MHNRNTDPQAFSSAHATASYERGPLSALMSTDTTDTSLPAQGTSEEGYPADDRGNNDTDGNDRADVARLAAALSGLDRDGDPKAVITVGLMDLTDGIDSPKLIRQMTLHNAYLSFVGYPGPYVLAEIEFKLLSNSYMKSFLESVREFHTLCADGQYGFCMTLASLLGTQDHFLAFECPLMCMQGISSRSGNATIVQLLFPEEGVYAAAVDYSLDEIRAEVSRETEALLESDTDDNDINEQIKETYGLGNGQQFDLKGHKDSSSRSLDPHMRRSDSREGLEKHMSEFKD